MKTIKTGYVGKEIVRLCQELQRNGYTVNESASYNDTLKQAVVRFQKENDLDADGIVGYRTWETLFFKNYEAEEKLSDKDYSLMAELLDCEVAALRAVQSVETGGRGGFFEPGYPAILFEGHIFWNQLKKRGIDPQTHVAGNENILYPKWDRTKYFGGIREHERLEQARMINKEAADASASWGMFQIMGFNYAACGEQSVASFVASMHENECKQFLLAGRFIRKGGMLPALQTKNWADFAKRYNGPAYAQNKYDEKLAAAYEKFNK